MTKGQKKEAFLILRVSTELKRRLKKEADADGVSLSEKVRQLLGEDG
ncbi:MAG: hypothetical protein QQN63_12810 [Nitrosopumilus sp.]